MPALAPPPDGALDRQHRDRQARLQIAHDDWALHAGRDDPRAAIGPALGLVRFHRRTVRQLIQRWRLTAAQRSEGRPLARRNRLKTLELELSDAYAAYRGAVTDAADAVGAFQAANGRLTATAATPRPPPHRR